MQHDARADVPGVERKKVKRHKRSTFAGKAAKLSNFFSKQ
jgi:hypothetical protein